MLEVFLIIGLIAIPLFKWRQAENLRTAPVIIGSCIAAAYVLAKGSIAMPWDYTSILAGCFVLLCVLSVMWTDNHTAYQEALTWASVLFVFTLSRFADFATVMAVILCVGVAFAVMPLVALALRRYGVKGFADIRDFRVHNWYIFGNPAHCATFFIVPFFISLWAGINISLFYFLTSALFIGQFAYLKCVGVIAGLLVGLIYALFAYFGFYALPSLLVIPAAWFVYGKFLNGRRKDGVHVRIVYLLAAWELLKKRYLLGYGLNAFRKFYPEVNPILFKNEKIQEIYKKNGIQSFTGHRAHCDLFEIAIELGVFGAIIFFAIFWHFNWSEINILFTGAFIAFAVSSFFFYAFREMHTSIPFWVFCGLIAGHPSTFYISIDIFVVVTLVIILARFVYDQTIRLYGAYFFSLADQTDGLSDDQRAELVSQAIACSPYNCNYLMWGVLLNIKKRPQIALEYAIRSAYHYDGGKVKWGVYDHVARTFLAINNLDLADVFLKRALTINPEFEPSLQMRNQLTEIRNNIEVRHGISRPDMQSSPA